MTKKINITMLFLLWIIGIWIIISMLFHNKNNFILFRIAHNNYFLFTIAIISTYLFGFKYIKKAYFELFKWKKTGMNFLVFLSTQTSIFYSIYQLVMNQTLDLIEASIFINFFLKTGDLITERLNNVVAKDLKTILSIQPKEAIYINDKEVESVVSTDSIKIGSIIKVKKDQIIPLDGELITNFALFNTQIIDGENNVKTFYKNALVFAGMVNKGEDITLKTTALKFNSYLSQIVMQVSSVQSQKSKFKSAVDLLVTIFTPLVIIISLFGFLLSYFYFDVSNLSAAFKVLTTVLVSACPCAIGIAIPLAIAIGSSKAAKKGVIFNKPDAFQRMAKIKVICFDKTGTLTKGEIEVEKFIGDKNYLNVIGLIQLQQKHPLANGFLNYLRKINFKIDKSSQLVEEKPRVYRYKEDLYEFIPSFKWSSQIKSVIDLSKLKDNLTTTFVLKNNIVVAVIIFKDKLRKDAKSSIKILNDKKYELVMITGDNLLIANDVANELGNMKVFAQQTPNSKLKIISDFQKQKKGVAFVGDGINDVLAIQKADLSIAIISSHFFVNLEADISLLNPNIELIYEAIKFARLTKIILITNLFWAFFYNILIIPLALSGILTPLFGMAIMFCSTLLVLLNSMLFKFKK
ncbi:copper-transporting ATPase [Spiroplasma gladiatoris]|uniref:Copper-transporting ATPase n=1 Tax=Spiroplasma gladiatoris TaxID=2143 RepID=A0A4P7AK21_9MOLU|nr:heavy metal translocating P-type ATPase [Spiroplasma gladiatoris]QBQ08188.1 copper-transporting ATPase [Spiroplasma gladiatoris]